MKILILTTIRAPYRVQLFDLIGRDCDLTVCYENEYVKGREAEWYDKASTNFRDVQLKQTFMHIKLGLGKIVDLLKPDIAIAYEYSTVTSLYFMTLCINKHIPYLINCDGGFIKSDFIKLNIKRFFIKHASGYLAGGLYAKAYLEHYGADGSKIVIHNFSSLHKSDILDNPISKNEKKNYKRELGIKEKHVIVAVGQFIHRKGFDILIKACEKLDKDIGVYIIGGLPTEEYISLCKKLMLDNIHFIEFQTFSKLKKYYYSSDLVVLPTREDIWGLVINEAMACGAPVITTNRCIAGLELIVNGENGFVVNVDDLEQLVSRINEILKNDIMMQTMEKNNLVKISNYTIETMAKIQMEFYEKFVIFKG